MGIIAKIVDNRWAIAWTVVSIYLLAKIHTYRRLRGFRGPFSVGFTNYLQCKALLSFNFHLWHKRVIDDYGPIARIGPNELITNSPELLAHMSAVRLDTEELVSESVLQVVAGSDTTATALLCIFLYVMTHPRVYRQLQREIDAVGKGKGGV